MKTAINVLIGTIATIGFIILGLVLTSGVFASNVTDNGKGNHGYILVSTGNGHQGEWTDPSFLKGAKGDKGDTGATGAQGIQGIQGIKGNTGSQGSQGVQGIKGDTGTQGLAGTNGLNGIDGRDGAQGIAGQDGLNGQDGNNGIDGKDGIQGIQGDKGDTGADGKDVDPATVTNLQNTDITLQNNINTESIVRSNSNNILQTNINNESTTRFNADNALGQRIDDTNGRVDNLDKRVHRLEETKYLFETVVRLTDTRKTRLEIFDSYDVGHSSNFAIGVRFTYKMGKSFEEKMIEKTNKRIDMLEARIGYAPVIEKTVDSKGNVKSIHISQNGLQVEGRF